MKNEIFQAIFVSRLCYHNLEKYYKFRENTYAKRH